MSKSSNVSKVLERQVSKVKGSKVNYEVQGFRRSLKVDGLKIF